MGITRKIEEVIERGGKVKTDLKGEPTYKLLTQKVRVDMLEQVDAAINDRPGMNRSAWIQEAIQEKLKRLKDNK
jgi:hypothetical protein